jgi:uncharacterized protein (DUF983 family)
MGRLYRFTFFSFLAWAAVSVAFLLFFGFCDEENCPTWQKWAIWVTFVAACGLLVLTVGAALVTLTVRFSRRRA